MTMQNPIRTGWLGALVAAAAAAQAPSPRVGVDPYTRGEPAALARAGYASLGPFALGRAHGSADVEALVGDEPLHWIETAHFRIGCAAAALPLRGDSEWTTRVRGELKALRARLPVPATVRELDPWLRAHLVAQRCEALYQEIRDRLGVRDDVFPPAPGDDRDGEPRDFHGLGPHLGMPSPFVVLIFRRGASQARYTKAQLGAETTEPRRHFDSGAGALLFAVAEESTGGLLADDLALHTHLTYNLAYGLYNCYRYYGHDLPPWLVIGLAHWHARRICPRFPAFEHPAGDRRRETRSFWQWGDRAPGLLAKSAFEPLATLMARSDPNAFDLEQHIEAWAFVDFLMATRPAQTMQFVHAMKDPFHRLRWQPSAEEVHARARERLALLGGDAPELEAAWRRHLRVGPRRRARGTRLPAGPARRSIARRPRPAWSGRAANDIPDPGARR